MSKKGTLNHWAASLKRIGWFIPPYAQMGFIAELVGRIEKSSNLLSLVDLETELARLYEPLYLAPMVMYRCSAAPFIQDFRIIIGEAVEAHFLGLDHVAVSGLMPVIEGAGRRLAKDRGLTAGVTRHLFRKLADHCKPEIIAKQIGAVGEVISMLDSFADYA